MSGGFSQGAFFPELLSALLPMAHGPKHSPNLCYQPLMRLEPLNAWHTKNRIRLPTSTGKPIESSCFSPHNCDLMIHPVSGELDDLFNLNQTWQGQRERKIESGSY